MTTETLTGPEIIYRSIRANVERLYADDVPDFERFRAVNCNLWRQAERDGHAEAVRDLMLENEKPSRIGLASRGRSNV